MTTAAVIIAAATFAFVGISLAAIAHRDLTQAQARAQLNADLIAQIKRRQDEAADFADWEQEYREVES